MEAVTKKLRNAVSAGRDKIGELDAGWILEEKLLQMSTPGGSVHQFWRNPESEVLKFCLENNIKTILKLNMGDRYDVDLFERNGVCVNTLNWADHQAPTLEKGILAVTLLWQAYQRHASAVHCTAGIGRSGLISASFLIFIGMYSVDDAIQRVRSKRKKAIKNPPQIEFLHRFHDFLQVNPWIVKEMRAMAVVPPSNIELTELYWSTIFRNNEFYPGFSPYGEIQMRSKVTFDALLPDEDVYQVCLQENADRYPALYEAIAAQQEFLNIDMFGLPSVDTTQVSVSSASASEDQSRGHSTSSFAGPVGVHSARHGSPDYRVRDGNRGASSRERFHSDFVSRVPKTVSEGNDAQQNPSQSQSQQQRQQPTPMKCDNPLPSTLLNHPDFSCPLSQVAEAVSGMPYLIRRACNELWRIGPMHHLFSIFGSSTQISDALESIQVNRAPISRLGDRGIELAPSLSFILRHFLWMLPEPLLPKPLQIRAIERCVSAEASINLLCELPRENLATLSGIMCLLGDLSRDTQLHNMQVSNLAMFFAPAVFQLRGDIPPKLKSKDSNEDGEGELLGSVPVMETEWSASLPVAGYENADVHLHSPPCALAGATRFLYNLIRYSAYGVSRGQVNAKERGRGVNVKGEGEQTEDGMENESVRDNHVSELSRSKPKKIRKDTFSDDPDRKFHVRQTEKKGSHLMYVRATMPFSDSDDGEEDEKDKE